VILSLVLRCGLGGEGLSDVQAAGWRSPGHI
jgi:hypothetical protein